MSTLDEIPKVSPGERRLLLDTLLFRRCFSQMVCVCVCVCVCVVQEYYADGNLPPAPSQLKDENEIRELQQQPDFMYPNARLVKTLGGETSGLTCEQQWRMVHAPDNLTQTIQFMAEKHSQCIKHAERELANTQVTPWQHLQGWGDRTKLTCPSPSQC